jgi:glutathione S-transferase
MVTMENELVVAGYTFVMNQDRDKRADLERRFVESYAALDAFLRNYATGDGPWLFERFGWAECVFTPFFWRFKFVEYFEDWDLPPGEEFARVRTWRDACLAYPDAQQVVAEEVIKLYYDYARGAGNGALLEGRTRSSFVFEPHWKQRPMPPKDKYGPGATDAELGLI